MNSPVGTNMATLRQEDMEDAIDIFRMLRSVWLRKWAILSLALLAAAGTSFWMGNKPPVYEARATLLLESTQAKIFSAQDIYSTEFTGTDFMQTQFELMRARNIGERVVRKLALQSMERFKPRPPAPKPWYKFDLSSLKPAGFNSAPPKPWVMPSEDDQISSLTEMVSGGIKIEQVGESNVVALTYRADDPRLATSIVNTYVEEYIDSFLDAKLEQNLKTSVLMQESAQTIKEQAKTAEERLQAFREKEKLVDLQGVTTLSAQEFTTLTNNFNQSQQKRLELENTQKDLERLKGRPVEELLGIPALSGRDDIRRLKDAEAASQRIVNELSRRYGPKWPKLKDARTELAANRAALETAVNNEVLRIGREYRVAQENENAAKRKIDDSKLDVQDINRKQFEYSRLEQDVKASNQLYEEISNRIKETTASMKFDAPPARIIDKAKEGVEVGFDARESVILGFVLTFALGCGLAILLDTLENSLKSPSEVEERLHVPMLGTLPIMKKDGNGVQEEYWVNSRSEFAEAIRTIRTGVVLSSLDRPAKIIVVTSSVPGEGKSTTTLNLAAAFAQMEKTLIIGADLRRPSLAKRCNLPAKHPGLSNFVAGSAELEECIASFGDTQLSIMPAGIIPSNPLEMLSSRRLREALETLKTRFDRILIDSAPVAAVSDALMLASYADALIFVIKADATAASLARKSIAQLENAGDRLTGVVLNHFDPKKLTKYYDSYNYRYGGNYYNSSDSHG